MKFLLLLCLLIPSVVFAQVNWQTLQQHSTNVYAYKVTAADAERYIKLDSIDVDKYITQLPVATFLFGQVDESKLSIGLYVFVRVYENEVITYLTGVSNLVVYPVNNQQRVQLLVRNKKGAFINNARVWVNEKAAPYNADAQSYRVAQKFPDEALVKVYAPGDTTYLQLTAEDNLSETLSKQRWENFMHTRVMKTIAFVPRKIKYLLGKKYSYNNRSTGARVTIIFNQPKYKNTDTVKLKAYLFTKKNKQYNKAANVYLQYYANGKQREQLLAQLKPGAPGAFVFNFPLSDTLINDNEYTVIFKDSKSKTLLRGTFKIEDYLLDEVAKYGLRADKEDYYAGDSIHFFASASDANGLGLLDGTAKLVLTVNGISSFFKDQVYVPDTLFAMQKNIASEGETKFDLSTLNLPDANLVINADVYFKNSNNELQIQHTIISYKPGHEDFIATENADSLRIEYRVNGKLAKGEGMMSVSGDLMDDTVKVSYPLSVKIDPLADQYDFSLIKDRRKKDSAKTHITGYYNITAQRISQGDTLGFALQNNYKIPVSFTVFDGNKIVGSGNSSEATIVWKTKVVNKHKIYQLKWQYRWAGEEKKGGQSLALLYKRLNINIKNKPVIFPGEKDSVMIEVKDFKGKAAANVNLTAVSYNSQFAKDINVNEPPYLARYHSRKTLLRDEFEIDDSYFTSRYLLGKHMGWVKPFALDTLAYYNMLMPGKAYADYVTPLKDFNTELSVHVVKNAVPQEVYLLYLNNELKYYNGVTDNMPDAYSVFPGYVKIGVRLYDEFVALDSIYIQPFYKHDLFIDLDKLPAKTIVKTENFWSAYERSLLEQSIWMLDNSNRTNYGYAWQSDRVVKLETSNKHLVGPFVKNDSLHVFIPDDFDVHFRFEPGYQYNLSPKIERLEKMPLFIAQQQKIYLTKAKQTKWILGDTIVPHPKIEFAVKQAQLSLRYTYNNLYRHTPGNGKLKFTVAKDTAIRYIILYSEDSLKVVHILSKGSEQINNLIPGKYSLLLVNDSMFTMQAQHLVIKANETLCLNTIACPYTANHVLITQIQQAQQRYDDSMLTKKKIEKIIPVSGVPYAKGTASIKGRVTDKKGNAGIAYVTLFITGTNTGTYTNAFGYFTIANIKAGKCTLNFSTVGYAEQSITVDATSDVVKEINVQLTISNSRLDDVVVAAYGAQRQSKSLGYTVNRLYDLLSPINGVDLTSSSLLFRTPKWVDDISFPLVVIRGAATLAGDTKRLYVIDGIFYDEMPANISPDMIASMTVLKDAEALNLYGARAANGVIIITTQTKQQRTLFRDYAYWQPQFFTDKNGKASFVATYPDNITGWQTYVVGMDKKRRMGKAMSYVKSYKPISAQLSMPQFLVAGDSAKIIGKAFNYTNDSYTAASHFTINNTAQITLQNTLQPQSSAIQNWLVSPVNIDTLKAGYALQTTTGFSDGEDRSIPVFKQGTEEATGQFYVLQTDTTVNYKPAETNGSIELYAVNNTLQLLLDETEHLKEYPYYCMEQTASKLTGLLLAQQTKATLQKPFTDGKMVTFLTNKLQKAQQYNGGWGWWESGTENVFITNYVINALLPLRADAVTETAIRNGLLYLQNNLALQNKDALLQTLVTMGNAKHEIDYKTWLDKIRFDSLTQHQQWLYVRLKQQANLPHDKELNTLLANATPGVLGQLHWGTETWRWHNNINATTVLAFEVLRAAGNHNAELQGMMQYFLEQRRSGWWINTVESATITNALLPYILSVNKNFQQPASLQVSGDTTFSVTSFPFKTTMPATTVKNLQISKQGGGLTYLTLYQKFWNKTPQPVSNLFEVNSYFEKQNTRLKTITTGEKIKMMVTVNALKEADYVMIEIPIPAGCTYAEKKQDNWQVHKEFIKNKLVLFTELLTKGVHQYEIDLEPRYAGTYVVNPAKVSLMYFPTFYGRNELKKVNIEAGE